MERFNAGLGLRGPLRLDVERTHSVEEILDRHIKSTLASAGLSSYAKRGLSRSRAPWRKNFPAP
jgi:hypothetical protein